MTRRSLLVCLVALSCSPATAVAAPQVELRPAAGAAGSAMALRGTGFDADQAVVVTATGRRARHVRADDSGAFELSLRAPHRHRTVSIASRSNGVRVTNRFSVTSGTGAGTVLEVGSAGGQRLRVSPLAVLPGGTVSLRGSGFRARQRLQVSGLGTTTRLRAAGDGRFAAALRLPAPLRSGQATLSVSGRGVTLKVRLAAATPVPDPLVPATVEPTPAPAPVPPVVPEPATPPASTGAPAIAGAAKLGQALSATTGAWTGTAPLTLGFQWRRCDARGNGCTDVAGATDAGYVPVDADVAGTLRVVVTAVNAAGRAAATSSATAVVTAAPRNTRLPTAGGTPQEGQTLTAANDAWSGYPAVTSSNKAYQWLRCDDRGSACSPVPARTTKTYAIGAADVGKTLAVRVTVTTAAGTASADSLPTGVVSAAPAPTGVAALWHFDELSRGSVLDSAGTHNGTMSSGVTPGEPGGFLGSAFRFNGVDGNVRIPAADLNPNALDVTVTVHMKTPYRAPNTVEDWDLFKKGSYYDADGHAQPEIKMEYYPSGQASCGWAGTSATGKLTFHEIKNVGPVLDNDQWHTIQCVKTASAVRLVVDGATVQSKSIVIGSISNADPIVIGSHATGSEWFKGLIDEVSISYG